MPYMQVTFFSPMQKSPGLPLSGTSTAHNGAGFRKLYGNCVWSTRALKQDYVPGVNPNFWVTADCSRDMFVQVAVGGV